MTLNDVTRKSWMRRAWLRRVVASFALCGAFSAHAHAQQPANDSTWFAHVTQSLLDAVTNGDSAVWASHLSNGWFLTDEEGRGHTRAEFLRQLQPLPAGQIGTLRLGASRFASAPGVVVFSYDVDEEHNYYGQLLRTRFHATDTWVAATGGWKLLASQVTALPTPVTGLALPHELLARYAGTYALADTIRLEVVAQKGSLMLSRADRPAEQLHALDARTFVRHGARGYWVFEQNEAGAVVRLVHWRDNNAIVWRRTAP